MRCRITFLVRKERFTDPQIDLGDFCSSELVTAGDGNGDGDGDGNVSGRRVTVCWRFGMGWDEMDGDESPVLSDLILSVFAAQLMRFVELDSAAERIHVADAYLD